MPSAALGEGDVDDDEAEPADEGVKELVRSEVPQQNCQAGNECQNITFLSS